MGMHAKIRMHSVCICSQKHNFDDLNLSSFFNPLFLAKYLLFTHTQTQINSYKPASLTMRFCSMSIVHK